MIQKFLVQIDSSDNTRWLAGSEYLAGEIKYAAQMVAKAFSNGQIPAVSVIREEAPEKAGGQ